MRNSPLRNGVLVLALLASPVIASDKIATIARTCDNCHGTGGVSVGLSMPSIAGLSETYLRNIMMEWKTGARASASMTRLVKGLTDAEIAGLAAHYAKLPWTPVPQPVSAEVLARGKAATARCATCHGDTGGKPIDADTPILAGQWARYLELELMKYRDEGFRMPHQRMTRNVRRMEAGDVSTAAQFYGAQSQ